MRKRITLKSNKFLVPSCVNNSQAVKRQKGTQESIYNKSLNEVKNELIIILSSDELCHFDFFLFFLAIIKVYK